MKRLFCAVLLCCLLQEVHAQTYDEGSRIQAISHQVIIPEDGSLEELKGVVYEWTEGVLKACGAFEKVSLLYLDSDTDTLELLVLYEFKKDLAGGAVQQLIQDQISQKWPDEKDFQDTMKLMHRYIDPKQNRRRFYTEWLPDK